MKPIADAILEHAEKLPEGALIRAKDLLHLGSRSAVDKALSRLANGKYFLRVSRGIYSRFLHGRFGKYAPSTHLLVRNVAQLTGETVAPHAAVIAKNWELTTQVPMHVVYLTSGRSRKLKIGSGRFAEMRHVPSWQLAFHDRASGDALRVLAWRGPEMAAATLRTLKDKLSESDLQEMASVCPNLPAWLAKPVIEALENG